MNKTLIIILGETRAHELTFDSFKKNVFDVLEADLCLCIGVKPDYDYNNPFYKLAKHHFLYNEPDDFAESFDYVSNFLSQYKYKYEELKNINLLDSTLQKPKESTENIMYFGNSESIIYDNYDGEIVVYDKDFKDELLRDQTYLINNSENFISEPNVTSYKKPLHWREFLKLKDQFLGGIKDSENQHPGSAGILIFFRWFLLKNLTDTGLINKYDRFIITRSDYIYLLPHPKLEIMDENNIWIPDAESYRGYTDRHVILSRNNLEPYLNILTNIILKSNEYFIKMKMKNKTCWNLEQVIKFHLEENNVVHLVKQYPYVMYTVRNINGTTRWKGGVYSDTFGYYIKYDTEHAKACYYKNKFDELGTTIDEFYVKHIYNC